MATYGDATASYGDALRNYIGWIETLELVIRGVTYKTSDFVDPSELNNCNTEINDALDALSNVAFSGVETNNLYNDQTPSS